MAEWRYIGFLGLIASISRNDWRPYVLLPGNTRSSDDEPRFNRISVRLCIHFLLEDQYHGDRLGILQSRLFWNRQLLIEVSIEACLYHNGYQWICPASSSLDFPSKMITCKLQSALAVNAHLSASHGISASRGEGPLTPLLNLHHFDWAHNQELKVS